MFVNVETQIVFPRRLLCFELGLSQIKDSRGFKEMIEGMIKHSNSKFARLLLFTLFDIKGLGEASWSVEMVHFDFSRQCFCFMVSSPTFPEHQDGHEVRRVRNRSELLEVISEMKDDDDTTA